VIWEIAAMRDQLITCVQCKTDFEFSAVEQEYYNDKGFNPPRRCPQCRKNKSKSADPEHINTHTSKKKHPEAEYD
jgi:Probable zinc-ribbon domain